ncbi:MAG: hypothetical protein J1E33_04870 [Alistipes sp.]|nr:hypothetical protein [Alistipes sp.]
MRRLRTGVANGTQNLSLQEESAIFNNIVYTPVVIGACYDCNILLRVCTFATLRQAALMITEQFRRIVMPAGGVVVMVVVAVMMMVMVMNLVVVMQFTAARHYPQSIGAHGNRIDRKQYK